MRDTLARTIYASLFDWLIDCMNKSLTAHEKSKGRSINIIDIYGFESFNVGVSINLFPLVFPLYLYIYYVLF